MNARMPSWQRDPRLEQNHGSQAAMAAVAAPPAASHAAAAPPQIDLSDSDSNSSASSSCEIVELVGNIHLTVLTSKRRIISIMNVRKVYNQKR
jgi:hypothetical protein